MKPDYSLSPYTKIKSKWINDLNVRSEIINYIGKQGTKLINLGCKEYFMNLTPKAKEVKTKEVKAKTNK